MMKKALPILISAFLFLCSGCSITSSDSEIRPEAYHPEISDTVASDMATIGNGTEVSSANLGSVSEAPQTNYFERFAKESRYTPLLSGVTITTDLPLEAVLGEETFRAGINSAYYDGENLLVVYYLQNEFFMTPYEPDSTALQTMNVEEELSYCWTGEEENNPVFNQWSDYVMSGTPSGVIVSKAYVSDRVYAQNNIDFAPYSEQYIVDEDGTRAVLRECSSPLPEAAKNMDSLDLRIKVKQDTAYMYFDGEKFYTKYEDGVELGYATGTVLKTNGETERYSGSGSLLGCMVQLEAVVTDFSIRVTAISSGQLVSETENYSLSVVNENGEAANNQMTLYPDSGKIVTCCSGYGALPETLTVSLMLEVNGTWQNVDGNEPIVLHKNN